MLCRCKVTKDRRIQHMKVLRIGFLYYTCLRIRFTTRSSRSLLWRSFIFVKVNYWLVLLTPGQLIKLKVIASIGNTCWPTFRRLDDAGWVLCWESCSTFNRTKHRPSRWSWQLSVERVCIVRAQRAQCTVWRRRRLPMTSTAANAGVAVVSKDGGDWGQKFAGNLISYCNVIFLLQWSDVAIFYDVMIRIVNWRAMRSLERIVAILPWCSSVCLSVRLGRAYTVIVRCTLARI